MNNLFKEFAKLKRNRTLLLAIGVILCLLAAAAPPLERLILATLPDVAKIYDVERSHFTKYQVGVMKSYQLSNENQEISYSITLSSASMASDEELAIAGRLACSTDLEPGTRVRVIGQKQYFYLPIYFSKGTSGYCSDHSWVKNSPSVKQSPSQSQSSACHSADLAIAVTPSGRSTYANAYESLALTNKSAHTCSASGYPEVSLIGHGGAMLGLAGHDQTVAYETLTLTPGQTAYASLTFPNPDLLDPGACSAKATTLFVRPPGETTLSLSVPSNHRYCSGFDVTALSEDVH